MNSIARDYLDAITLKLAQSKEVIANVDIKGPSLEEQRRAMADPVAYQNLLGKARIYLKNGQKIYYRFPYPLPNGAFLLKGEIRTPGFFIPYVYIHQKEPLDLSKYYAWAGEIFRLNGFIKWLGNFVGKKEFEEIQIKEFEEIQMMIMRWTPYENEKFSDKHFKRENIQLKKLKKKNKPLKETCYYQRPNFPRSDRTNPLSEITSIREIRFQTPITQEDQKYSLKIPEISKIHQSHLGRVCILETSDDDPGEVLYLARGARVQMDEINRKSKIKDSNFLFGYSCSLIPFIQHNKPIRTIIGGRELKQALPLLNPDVPLVCTGVEKEIAEESGRLIHARNPGKIKNIYWTPQGGEIQVQQDSISEIDCYPLSGYTHVNSGEFQGGCYWENPKVSKGQSVNYNDILAEGCGVKNGKLALGVNLLVAYIPWFGYNFEDAIVISERAANRLTSLHVYEEKDERENFGKIDLKVRLGDKDIRFGEKITDKIRFSRHIKSGEVVRIIKTSNVIKIWILEKRQAEIGDKLTNRYGNKGIISLILPENKMPYFYINGKKRVIDIILHPTSIISRINLGQLFETHVSWVIHEIENRDNLKRYLDDIKLIKKSGTAFEENELNLEKLKDLLLQTGLDEYGKAIIYQNNNNEKVEMGSYVIGYQYFVKLRHLARDKIKVVGQTEERDPLTEQPKKGHKLSEFGVWALIAHKADNLIQELLSVRSDDVKGCKDLKFGQSLKTYYPENLRLIYQYIRGLGLEVEVCIPERSKKNIPLSEMKVQALRLRRATHEEMSEWGKKNKFKKKEREEINEGSEYDGFIRFKKDLEHPLYSEVKLKGIYEIPPEYRLYISADTRFELQRRYNALRHNRSKSLKSLIEGSEIITNIYDSSCKGILNFLQGKDGFFRKGSMGKRANYSVNAVIIPDPELNINEISIPEVVWEELELNENKPILAVRHPLDQRQLKLLLKRD